MAARVHTIPAAPSAIVPVLGSDAARLEAGASRLQALHEEAAAALDGAEPAPEDTEEAVRADLVALVAETRANAGDTRIPALDAGAAASCPMPENPAFAAAAQLAHDRRALHDAAAHAAALGEALGMPAGSVPAAFGFGGDGPHPDADLLVLGRAWQASADRCGRADKALDAAAERTPQVTVPEALFLLPSDSYALRCLANRTYQDTGRRWFYGEAVEQLRQAPEPTRRIERHEPAPWGGDDVVVRAEHFPDEVAIARRAEIVAADDAWRAEIAAAEAASGFTAADAEADAAHDENRALRRRIQMAEAETLAGVMAKARVAGWCWSTSAEMRRETADDAKRGNVTGEAMAFSLAADLVAWAERGAA